MTTTVTGHLVETGLVVADAAASAEFYCRVLGFSEIRRVDLPASTTGPAGLGDPGRLIWLAAPNGTIVKFFDGGTGSQYRPPATGSVELRHHFLTIYVDDLETVLERAHHEGAIVETPVVVLPTGVRLAFIRDPGGHSLELIERPTRSPADRGATT